MFKFYGSLIAGLTALALVPPRLPAAQRLTILYLNDTHGQIEAIKAEDGKTYGGFARIAFLVDSLRKEPEAYSHRLYFLHAGDALLGPPLSNAFKGELDFECFSKMGLTAMSVGNHEFDFGPKRILELRDLGSFPLLSANITDTSGERPFQAFVSDSFNGERLLIVGLTTEDVPVTTYPPNVSSFRFWSSESTLIALLDSIGHADKDLVIVLSHRGWEADSVLAERIGGVDLVVGGHSHTVLEKPLQVSKTLICQAGAKGVYLGKVDLEVNKGQITSWAGGLIPITDKIPSDSALSKKIREASGELDEKLRVPLGRTEVTLVPGLQAGRKGVLSIGDLLARLMLEETGADIAFTNQGAVRATVERGPVTMMDILTALPFQNTVVTLQLTGAQVQELLNYSLLLGSNSGGALHLAGINYEEKDGKAFRVRIGGAKLETKRTYKIATNNFLASGGDGYLMLTQGRNLYDTGTAVNLLLVRYLERIGTITEGK